MRLEPNLLKIVAYVCARGTEGKRVPVGTCFLIQLTVPRKRLFWVTAEHVINNSRSTNGQIWIRVNQRTGSPIDLETRKDDWLTTRSSDVAVCETGENDLDLEKLDLVSLEHNYLVDHLYKFPKDIEPTLQTPPSVAQGDDIAVIALFAQHPGQNFNLPIVRFGHVSRMPNSAELIRIDSDDAPTKRDIVAYLAEMQSWGGQSGAPVFCTVELTIKPKNLASGDVKNQQKKKKRFGALIGLVSGHFPIREGIEERGLKSKEMRAVLNSGISILVPAHFISMAIGAVIRGDAEHC